MSENELPEVLNDGDFVEEEFAEYADPEFAVLVVTGGGRTPLPIERNEDEEIIPQTIQEACAAADLEVPTSTQFWVEGAQVEPTALIQPGMRITAVGNVKGG